MFVFIYSTKPLEYKQFRKYNIINLLKKLEFTLDDINKLCMNICILYNVLIVSKGGVYNFCSVKEA